MGRKEEEDEVKSRMSCEQVSKSCFLHQQAHRAETGWQGRAARKGSVLRGACEHRLRPRTRGRTRHGTKCECNAGVSRCNSAAGSYLVG